MNKSFLIDSHQDIAYNINAFNRDYRRSAYETRAIEVNSNTPGLNGNTLLGWPEYQKGQVALIFATLYLTPTSHDTGNHGLQVYRDTEQAYKLHRAQVDAYMRLADSAPDMFRLVRSVEELDEVLQPWVETPASFPDVTHPTGLVMLMEGAEGIRDVRDIEEWWEAGVRMLGPVWGGGRFCGGTLTPGGFTSEGHHLLESMADLGYVLDISHMNEVSAREALDRYEGVVVATHANARALLEEDPRERHLSDHSIRHLIERDGVIGVIPFNRFLKTGWTQNDSREDVTLADLVAHIDHICQLGGSASNAAIGTDFDGGFGYPSVPLEIDTIADMVKIVPLLEERGYNKDDIADILGNNWRRILTQALPER